MTIQVTANSQTLAAAKRKLAAARDAIKADGVAMKQVAIYLDQWVQRNFQGKGGKVGGWAGYKYGGRLSRKSKANGQSIDGKRWINGTAQMLQDTGALRHSFLPFVKLGTVSYTHLTLPTIYSV